jgi:hypothetical protein
VRISLWINRKLVSSDIFDLTEGGNPEELAQKHVKLAGTRPHMIEFEFLDEPDQLKRFLRVGTDPRGMVKPIALDL